MNERKYNTLQECEVAIQTVRDFGLPVPEWMQRQYDAFQVVESETPIPVNDMEEQSNRHYVIEVRGQILADDKIHYVQNWCCKDLFEPISEKKHAKFDNKTRIVNGDLILNENRRAVPYAIYCTEKGIAAASSGDISCAMGYLPAWEYYKENIEEISSQLEFEIPDEVVQVFYRGLFIEVFSTLELFLSDFILCIIYSNGKAFEKAIEYFKDDQNIKYSNSLKIEKNMHNFFFQGVVYHRFDDVKKMLGNIVEIEMPDYAKLKRFLHKRNNIVHRFSYSNKDRMLLTTINSEDVYELIKASDKFVNQLIENWKVKQENFIVKGNESI